MARKIFGSLVNVPLILFLGACAHGARKTEPRLAVQADAATRAVFEGKGPRFAVATQGQAASRAAKDIFDAGGNIVDAAVAASFVIAVERPHSTGIGGGGFMMIRLAKQNLVLAVDFRERAPGRARERMYLDADGRVDPLASIDGPLAVAVPGLVAGLFEIHHRYGQLSWERVLKPAIDLAERGFTIYPALAKALEKRREVLARFAASKKIFLNADGSAPKAGDRLTQKDLARTLRLIARRKREGFYGGPVARALVDEMRRRRGLISTRDLQTYSVKWRAPLHGSFLGYDIFTMPPPSSGGAHVLEILNTLEPLPLAKMGFQSAEAVHYQAAAMQLAFADRAKYLGDADYVTVPVDGLISKLYAKSQLARIPQDQALRLAQVEAGDPWPYESHETTHFSIMNADGDMVASTQTINGYFGSGVVVPGTGVLLNNEMDDFSAKPGAQNLFGAVGGLPNKIEPGKRPLSSMSPTLVLRAGQPVLSIGAPGGTHILTCVAGAILNELEFRLPLYESIAAVRLHHQWQPDELEIERPGLAPDVMKELGRMGYAVKLSDGGCRVLGVAREGTTLDAVADPRDFGLALAE